MDLYNFILDVVFDCIHNLILPLIRNVVLIFTNGDLKKVRGCHYSWELWWWLFLFIFTLIFFHFGCIYFFISAQCNDSVKKNWFFLIWFYLWMIFLIGKLWMLMGDVSVLCFYCFLLQIRSWVMYFIIVCFHNNVFSRYCFS